MNALKLSCLTFMFLMVFVFAGFFSPAWSSDGVVIKGFKKAEVSDDTIYLGKICTVTGKDAAQIRQIRGIALGRAPLPGNSRGIDTDYIRLRLKQAKVDPDRVRFRMPETIEVSRASVTISPEEIKRAVDNFIRANVSWDQDRVKIRKIEVNTDVVLPKGDVSYRIEPLRNAQYKGNIALPIHFTVNGLFQKRILATADVSLLTDVVIVKKSLRRHGRINEDDIELKEKDLSKTHSNVITDPEEVLGKRAKRSIAAGTILRTNHIEYPPLVKRGDVVLVVAESVGLRVTALGVVDQREGRRGERIKVENLDSKKNIYARVLDSKTVEVDF
ncbi:MAG: flagellar basal body P-ring formation chaperone FlgA [Deltaproteobacteria bacterium]|nr:flagellar basal body P-ring formation chaperone FlgA [Deltaproteobacteria bacterium]